MPCRHYESDDWGVTRSAPQVKDELDKMARIACAAMEELVKQGKADFLVLKNEEVRTWWEAHIEADRKEKAKIAEQERRERVKREALDRLTDEEKELLGLKKPVTKKHKKHEPKVVDDILEWIEHDKSEYQELDRNEIQYVYDALTRKR